MGINLGQKINVGKRAMSWLISRIKVSRKKALRTTLKETKYDQRNAQNSTTEKHVGRAVPSKRL
jgi:hypothetical protein